MFTDFCGSSKSIFHGSRTSSSSEPATGKVATEQSYIGELMDGAKNDMHNCNFFDVDAEGSSRGSSSGWPERTAQVARLSARPLAGSCSSTRWNSAGRPAALPRQGGSHELDGTRRRTHFGRSGRGRGGVRARRRRLAVGSGPRPLERAVRVQQGRLPEPRGHGWDADLSRRPPTSSSRRSSPSRTTASSSTR